MSYEIHFPPSPCVLRKRVKAQHKSFSSNAETLTEAVQCTDDQKGSQPMEQAGHSRYGARKFLEGKKNYKTSVYDSRVLPVAKVLPVVT